MQDDIQDDMNKNFLINLDKLKRSIKIEKDHQLKRSKNRGF